jgi:pimeloyl-ACP methyl ester carboxylesterase
VAAHGSQPDTSGRHLTAMARTPSLFGRITALRLPTLVVHGDRDPVFSLELGEALHRAIPRARFRCIPGMGHIFPPQWSPLIGRLIADHLAWPERADPGRPVS